MSDKKAGRIARQVISEYAAKYGVSIADLKKKGVGRVSTPACDVRFLVWLELRQRGLGMSQIGKYTGGFSEKTVGNRITKMNNAANKTNSVESIYKVTSVQSQFTGEFRKVISAVCDKCGHEDTITPGGKFPALDLVNNNFINRGWEITRHGKKKICQSCRVKTAGAAPVPDGAEAKPDPVKTALPPATKLKIIEWLKDLFDPEAGRYEDGYSDKRLGAEKNVPWKHIHDIREEFFGPVKVDPELMNLRIEMQNLRQQYERLDKDITPVIEKLMDRMDGLKTQMQAADVRLKQAERRVAG